MTRIRILSLFLAIVTIAWSAPAMAQLKFPSVSNGFSLPVATTPSAAPTVAATAPDAPKVTVEEPCAKGDEACAAKLLACQEDRKNLEGDLQVSRDSADKIYRACMGAVGRAALAPKPPPKPIKYECVKEPAVALPRQEGNLCTCGNEAFVAVVHEPWKSMVCVPANTLGDLMGLLKKRLDALRLVDLTEFTNLTNAFERLQRLVGNPSGYDNFAGLYGTVLERIADHEARIKQLRTDVDGLMTKKAAERKPMHSTGLSFEELFTARPLVGVGMLGNIVLRQNWWFTPDSPLSIPMTFDVGYYSSFDATYGPTATIGGTLGLRLDLTEDRRHSLELAGQFTQFMILHPSGYQGVVLQQGMGFFLGPRLSYGFETKYFRLGCSVAVGGGKSNALPNTGVMLEGGGPQFMGGCNIGGHVRYGE